MFMLFPLLRHIGTVDFNQCSVKILELHIDFTFLLFDLCPHNRHFIM